MASSAKDRGGRASEQRKAWWTACLIDEGAGAWEGREQTLLAFRATAPGGPHG